MSKHKTEIGIVADLAVQLSNLATLERFQLGGDDSVPRVVGVEVTFQTPYSDNESVVHQRMGQAFAEAIEESAHHLVRNAVAHQRGKVESLRKQLADHYASENRANGADVGIETFDQMPTTLTIPARVDGPTADEVAKVINSNEYSYDEAADMLYGDIGKGQRQASLDDMDEPL